MLWLLSFLRRLFIVVDSMLIVTPIVGFSNYSMFCCALRYVHSSFAIIVMGKREKEREREIEKEKERAGCFTLFVFLVSRICCVALPHDATGLSAAVIVAFPDHTLLLF